MPRRPTTAASKAVAPTSTSATAAPSSTVCVLVWSMAAAMRFGSSCRAPSPGITGRTASASAAISSGVQCVGWVSVTRCGGAPWLSVTWVSTLWTMVARTASAG